MDVESTFPHVVVQLGGLAIRDTVVVTWVLMLLLAALSYAATRKLSDRPGPLQNTLEAALEAVEQLIGEVTHFDPAHFLPLIGTLAVFLFAANSVSLIPAVGSPTRDLNTASALAAVVFFSVHIFGLRLVGVRYLKNYLEPSWLLLPFNIVGEITRTLALALRLFGNMLSSELVVAILVLLSTLFVPIPMQLLGLLLGLIQAYVFTLLAMVYIAAGLDIREERDST